MGSDGGKEGEGNGGEEARTVAEQVDYLLEVATNVNHLSHMFEGWASWV